MKITFPKPEICACNPPLAILKGNQFIIGTIFRAFIQCRKCNKTWFTYYHIDLYNNVEKKEFKTMTDLKSVTPEHLVLNWG